MRHQFIIPIALIILVSQSVQGSPAIRVSDHRLLANKDGQIIQIYVTGQAPVSGLNFNAQIGGGGSAVTGGIDSGPIITGVDLITGTIFEGNNVGQTDLGSLPQLAMLSTVTQFGSVSAEGLLATITVDTTGLYAGTYALRLENTLNDATDFAGVPAEITDGTISIVPEPASIVLLSGAVATLLVRQRHGHSRPRV